MYIIDKSVTLKTMDVEKHMANFGKVGGVKLVGLGPRGSEFEVKLALNSGLGESGCLWRTPLFSARCPGLREQEVRVADLGMSLK